jgi:hypothetical protein
VRKSVFRFAEASSGTETGYCFCYGLFREVVYGRERAFTLEAYRALILAASSRGENGLVT